MKIIITGSLGHIGKPLTQTLVSNGHAVTVISSQPERKKDIEALGANAAIGSIDHAEFLASTFLGADAVYSMLPPPDFTRPDLDLMALTRRMANNYSQAMQVSGVKRLVHLSSIGAHLEKGSGLILTHHDVENILNQLTGVGITFMRPTAFYYNLYSFLEGIKHKDSIASNYGAEDKVSWVSPVDIADAIAEEITLPVSGRKIRYVASEDLTCDEVARILGSAIGKPDLPWIRISDEQMLMGLESFGVPKPLAAGLVEMNASMHTGILFEDYNLHKPLVMGKIKMADFAQEFAFAFNQK